MFLHDQPPLGVAITFRGRVVLGLRLAMEFAARNMKITLPADDAVDAEIDLGPEGGAFSLAARLYVSLPGMERATAERLIEATHQVCPFREQRTETSSSRRRWSEAGPMKADSDKVEVAYRPASKPSIFIHAREKKTVRCRKRSGRPAHVPVADPCSARNQVGTQTVWRGSIAAPRKERSRQPPPQPRSPPQCDGYVG